MMGHFVRRFLIEEMEADRNLSPNTQKSYRDTIRLLFRYVCEHHGAEPVRVPRNGPRELDSGVSEIFLGFQAAKSR